VNTLRKDTWFFSCVITVLPLPPSPPPVQYSGGILHWGFWDCCGWVSVRIIIFGMGAIDRGICRNKGIPRMDICSYVN
jgi:hypothetical protein